MKPAVAHHRQTLICEDEKKPMTKGVGQFGNGRTSISSSGYRRANRKPFTTIFTVIAFVVLLTIFHAWDDQLAAADRAVLAAGSWETPPRSTVINPEDVWDKIEPSSELEYQSCYDDKYQCARLELPMNYKRTNGEGSKIQIAVVKLPARVSITDDRYGGPVFVNPGGPGGSGVEMVLQAGTGLQSIVDPEGDLGKPGDGPIRKGAKYFDIISFDPRAVGRTTPSISCFPDAYSRENWMREGTAIGILGSSDSALSRHWYRSLAQGHGCSEAFMAANDTVDALGEHVNTTPVIRDLLGIAEAHDRWLSSQKDTGLQVNELKRDEGQEPVKIQYWGFSYGTIIGQTLASMYPDRVARVVVDGVVDPNDYHHGPWFTNLPDTDKILRRLFEYCSEAGPEQCPLYVKGGPSAIMTAYDTMLKDIYNDPLPVSSSFSRGPDVITWSDVVSLMRLAMYQPLIESPLVSTLISSLLKGNGSAFADYKQKEYKQKCPTEACKLAGPYSTACNRENYRDASSAIMCTDSPGLGEIDLHSFEDYMNKLANQSLVLGHWWSHERLGCAGWKVRAKWRFSGPFGANTSHPLLFIGNTLDPVTPFSNALRNSKLYPGAVLLHHKSEGHTSIAAPSICIAQSVRRYFQTGQLPKEGTTCEPPERPFLGRTERETLLSSEDETTLRALKSIGKTLHHMT